MRNEVAVWFALGLVVSMTGCRTDTTLPPLLGTGGIADAPGSAGAGGSGAPSKGDASTDSAAKDAADAKDGPAEAGGAVDAPTDRGVTPDTTCDAGPEREALDVFLLVDASGSLQEPVDGTTKWDHLNRALASFLGDPRTAGLAVALQLMPWSGTGACQDDMDCGFSTPPLVPACRGPSACKAANGTLTRWSCLGDAPCPNMLGGCVLLGRCSRSGTDCAEGVPCPGGAGDTCEDLPRSCQITGPGRLCTPASYATPVVPFGPLPGTGPAVKTAVLTRKPGGATPLLSAVEGVLGFLGQQVATRPGRRAVLVLLSDGGAPGGCANGELAGAVMQIEAARKAGPPVATYAVGFAGLGPVDTIAAVARAGGTQPLLHSTGVDLGQKLAEAIDKDRGRGMGACPKM